MHERLAFVDLETTGGTPTADRVTEVGIIEVDEQGVREWSSLVNPQTRIPPFIESLTGISNEMVASAPTFEKLAAEIHARIEGRVFIAHNARFDHGFLKNEFKRVGYAFRPTVLCTVKLSRRLFPDYSRHNLDAIVERHCLAACDRHRALGDARLIWQFWQLIHATLPAERILSVCKQLTARPSLPSHLDPGLIDELPSSHGVYLFYGENDLPLYIGKANNLRRRVLSHFSGDHQSSKELKLSQQIRRIDWIETAGEIGALLKESALIKQLSPTHNHRLRRNEEVCAWRLVQSKEGSRGPCFGLASADDLFFGRDDTLYGAFTSARKAINALTAIADEHRLCHALLGLQKVRAGKPCFASQIKRCAGACVGRESLESHHARLAAALAPLQLKAWPYPGPIGIREADRLHVVDGWAYLGTASSEEEVWTLVELGKPRFDRDVYQILHKRLPKLAPRQIHVLG